MKVTKFKVPVITNLEGFLHYNRDNSELCDNDLYSYIFQLQ